MVFLSSLQSFLSLLFFSYLGFGVSILLLTVFNKLILPQTRASLSVY